MPPFTFKPAMFELKNGQTIDLEVIIMILYITYSQGTYSVLTVLTIEELFKNDYAKIHGIDLIQTRADFVWQRHGSRHGHRTTPCSDGK